MLWRDRSPADRPDRWSGLTLTVERRGRPALWTEYASPGLIRCCSRSGPLLWARVAGDWSGLSWLRADRPPAVIPPLTAAQSRAIEGPPASMGGYAGWARAFARRLHAAGCLDRGVWALEPCSGPGLRVPDPDAVACARVSGINTLARQPLSGHEPWGLDGSGGVLLLRPLSPPDASRVRALRKRARSGTLAPLLLYFVSALDMYLLIDGHDRLRAALAEGVAPAALGLVRLRRTTYAPSPSRQAAVIRSVGRALADPDRLQRRSMDRLNQHLIAAFAEPVFEHARTVAHPLPGGAARWRQDVGDRI